MRLPWPAVAGAVAVAAVGAAGLVRGAMPQSTAGSSVPGQISVTGAFVRAPVPPSQFAAAYFTVHNTTGKADRLLGVQTGAGATATLHDVTGGGMSTMKHGAVVPAHGTLTLSTGHGHVMIGQLFGRLEPGQTVDLELDFATAGPIDVVAPVVAVGHTPPPSSGASS